MAKYIHRLCVLDGNIAPAESNNKVHAQYPYRNEI